MLRVEINRLCIYIYVCVLAKRSISWCFLSDCLTHSASAEVNGFIIWEHIRKERELCQQCVIYCSQLLLAVNSVEFYIYCVGISRFKTRPDISTCLLQSMWELKSSWCGCRQMLALSLIVLTWQFFLRNISPQHTPLRWDLSACQCSRPLTRRVVRFFIVLSASSGDWKRFTLDPLYTAK